MARYLSRFDGKRMSHYHTYTNRPWLYHILIKAQEQTICASNRDTSSTRPSVISLFLDFVSRPTSVSASLFYSNVLSRLHLDGLTRRSLLSMCTYTLTGVWSCTLTSLCRAVWRHATVNCRSDHQSYYDCRPDNCLRTHICIYTQTHTLTFSRSDLAVVVFLSPPSTSPRRHNNFLDFIQNIKYN